MAPQPSRSKGAAAPQPVRLSRDRDPMPRLPVPPILFSSFPFPPLFVSLFPLPFLPLPFLSLPSLFPSPSFPGYAEEKRWKGKATDVHGCMRKSRLCTLFTLVSFLHQNVTCFIIDSAVARASTIARSRGREEKEGKGEETPWLYNTVQNICLILPHFLSSPTFDILNY